MAPYRLPVGEGGVVRLKACRTLLTALLVAACTAPSCAEWSRVPDEKLVLAGTSYQTMLGVTAGGPGLVAVGWDASGGDENASVWTSPDGVTWSRVPHDEAVLGGRGSQWMLDVTAGGPGLVAVGWDASGGDENAAVWTSPDGATWSRVVSTEGVFGGDGDQEMLSVTSGGPGVVAVGLAESEDWDAAVWTSPDGANWSRVLDDDGALGGDGFQVMLGVTSGGLGLVAVGWDSSDGDLDAAVWTSLDGLSWSRVPHEEAIFGGDNDQEMWAVTSGGQGLVAVGADTGGNGHDAAVWSSADGTTWVRIPDVAGTFGGEGDQEMCGVASGGVGVVAVGWELLRGDENAAVWTSPDGVTWSRLPRDHVALGGEGLQSMFDVVATGLGSIAVGLEALGEDYDAAVWATAPES